MEHLIEDEEDNLLSILSLMYPNSSNSKLRKMLTGGRVSIDGELVHKAKTVVKKGQKITVTNKSEAMIKSPPPNRGKKSSKLTILHEDNQIIVVIKPSGLLSVATNKLEKNTLHSRCVNYMKSKSQREWCHIVHRLDRDTSGVMVFAKDVETKKHLQSQFSARSVERIYHALVEGNTSESKGTDIAWIYEDKKLNVKRVRSNFRGAREAITHWELINQNDLFSLMRIKIDTGRRHQIRLAMKNLGTPVVGDLLHGAKTNKFNRICLHASKISFNHPKTNDLVTFESNAPFII